MIGYKIVNLKLMVDAVGEDTAQAVLSTFSCPLNEIGRASCRERVL